jgi:hypothetical protein
MDTPVARSGPAPSGILIPALQPFTPCRSTIGPPRSPVSSSTRPVTWALALIHREPAWTSQRWVARREDVQYSNGLNNPWAPGRRVYPSAVATTISGVDIRWNQRRGMQRPFRLRKAYGATGQLGVATPLRTEPPVWQFAPFTDLRSPFTFSEPLRHSSADAHTRQPKAQAVERASLARPW